MVRTLYKESAFRHGFRRHDYREVRRNANVVLRSRRGDRNVYEILGRNDAGDYLHIVVRRYRQGEDRIELVFHINAMNSADRKRFRKIIRT